MSLFRKVYAAFMTDKVIVESGLEGEDEERSTSKKKREAREDMLVCAVTWVKMDSRKAWWARKEEDKKHKVWSKME